MKKFSIIPCPHEATTSYGRGTKHGPQAIIRALEQVENFDEELGRPMVAEGSLQILKPTPVAGLASRVTSLLSVNVLPVILGGEHSLTPVAVKALAEKYQDLSVLQLDAHADLRDSYQGSKNSHACAMRRTLEICPVVQAGIRNIAAEEWEWANKTGQIKKIHFAAAKYNSPHLSVGNSIVPQLSNHVYITIDVDVFDPAMLPATGTPEPGGLFWYEVLDILRGVCAAKTVVGFDLVELSPRRGDIASDFTTAKLLYKLIGYLANK